MSGAPSGTLRVRNWSEFQHYKHRNPPWIKLHRKLLDNREYQGLDDAAKSLLTDLWLIASESDDGCMAFDSDALAWRLRRPTQNVRSSIQVLIRAGFLVSDGHDASSVLALRLQDATTETEKSRDRDRVERETEGGAAENAAPPIDQSAGVAWQPINEPKIATRLTTSAGRNALSAVLKVAGSKTGIVAELEALLAGDRGPAHCCTPEQLDIALSDYVTNGMSAGRWNAQHFRACVRRAMQPTAETVPAPTHRRGGVGQRSADNALRALQQQRAANDQ